MSEERKPLLSDADIRRYGYDEMDVREIYETLITTGRLRVVKEVKRSDFWSCSTGWFTHDDCAFPDGYMAEQNLSLASYCPGCGAKIIEG